MSKYAQGINASTLSLVDVPSSSKPASRAESPAAHDRESPGSLPVESAEDRFLLKAAQERAAGHTDAALWARAIAQAGGDESQAKQTYLHSRATALRVEKRKERETRRALVVEKLSNAPERGVEPEPPTPAARTTPKEVKAGRLGWAMQNRRRVILIGGVAATLIVGGLVVMLSTSAPAQQSIAKSAAPASASARATRAKESVPSREDTAEDFAARVESLQKAGNWNVLVIHAAEWSRKQPGNPDAWRELARGYVKLHQWPDALDAAGKATQLAPRDAVAWQSLGEAYLALQRPADAETAFAQALALSPDNVDALCGAASSAQQSGRAKDADAMRSRAAALDGRCRDPNAGESVRVVARSSK